jgi:hypothetical protein
MSDTIWLEIHDGRDKAGGDRDHSIMLRLADDLDALAGELGVPKLSSFFDNTALADAYADEMEGADLPPVELAWFDASAGLQTLDAVIRALRDNPAAVQMTPDPSRSHWPAMLLDELEACHASLVEAEQRGHRFHFLIVP